jgi:hypothetical protein
MKRCRDQELILSHKIAAIVRLKTQSADSHYGETHKIKQLTGHPVQACGLSFSRRIRCNWDGTTDNLSFRRVSCPRYVWRRVPDSFRERDGNRAALTIAGFKGKQLKLNDPRSFSNAGGESNAVFTVFPEFQLLPILTHYHFGSRWLRAGRPPAQRQPRCEPGQSAIVNRSECNNTCQCVIDSRPDTSPRRTLASISGAFRMISGATDQNEDMEDP